jgi:hypothetical protein
LIAMIIVGLAAAPLVAPAFGVSSPDDAIAYASFGGGARSGDPVVAPRQVNNNCNGNVNTNTNLNDNCDGNDNNNNNNDNGCDDDNGNSNNNDNNNNGNCNGNNNNNSNNNNSNNNNGNDNGDNGNGNNNGNDNGDNGNGNDNGDGNDNIVIVRRPNESVNRPTKCFDTREVGVVQLGTGSFDVTVTVMPHSSFNQTTRLTLRRVDPGSVPAVPGSLVDRVVFSLDAQSSCDGAAINPLPNLVNMGIVYNVPVAVDKARLQIVRLEGGSWVNVDTVPDPVAGNPYVSGTINTAGTYALIQR